jgi:hypothetical protein
MYVTYHYSTECIYWTSAWDPTNAVARSFRIARGPIRSGQVTCTYRNNAGICLVHVSITSRVSLPTYQPSSLATEPLLACLMIRAKLRPLHCPLSLSPLGTTNATKTLP